jgi:hypothetical protein
MAVFFAASAVTIVLGRSGVLGREVCGLFPSACTRGDLLLPQVGESGIFVWPWGNDGQKAKTHERNASKDNDTLVPIPVLLPSEAKNPDRRRAVAMGTPWLRSPPSPSERNSSNASVDNRSSAEKLFDNLAQKVAQEARARAVGEMASQGELVDVPARNAGPRCREGHQDCEWEVLNREGVNVRDRPTLDAQILGRKLHGSVVVGRLHNGTFIRLAGEPGYMAIEEENGTQLLAPREQIWYEKVVTGTCADIGRYPILDHRSCEVAAQTLGLTGVGPFDNTMRVLEDNVSLWVVEASEENDAGSGGKDNATADNASSSADNASGTQKENTSSTTTKTTSTTTTKTTNPFPRPEGCYMDAAGALRINLEPSNIGNGAVGFFQPICATMTYPSTQTTTSTTSSTITTTRTDGYPSLLCFSYMRPWTAEEALIKQQVNWGRGIFACDDTIVISSAKKWLGKTIYGEDVFTWENPPTSNAMGNLAQPGVTTNSWLNTLTFIVAFETILNDEAGRVWKKDFFVKADPDAVFFPDRLRNHVVAHVGQPVFWLNCGGSLYGALEIYSKQAMQMYKDGQSRCRYGMAWQGWGEDMFMSGCMRMLGVGAVYDNTMVGDARCNGAPCSDTWRAAFHPFKDPGGWMWCWRQSAHDW